jgi:hypothetical protein
MTGSSHWLKDEMGFDSHMLKMVPSKNRWELCLAGDDPTMAGAIASYRDSVHPILLNWIWQSHLDEFYQDTGVEESPENCHYILRQSGPGWVRWYTIFVDDQTTGANARYYMVVVFEDEFKALTYRLSV